MEYIWLLKITHTPVPGMYFKFKKAVAYKGLLSSSEPNFQDELL